ncbi:hypothetical protein D9758_017253 [Tetrapyrgos nigripes]|uniref:UBL3-like ubiquitin domain-containing protein n=1 Tax=Tetrapyrgos nigripes TaxID=182062 RepID=A0A8H5C5V9_9AGAR|nr:hypothetical protein D9758_017253 [Tetrapyrgos nigripes]
MYTPSPTSSVSRPTSSHSSRRLLTQSLYQTNNNSPYASPYAPNLPSTHTSHTSLTHIDHLVMENPDSDLGRPLDGEEVILREREVEGMEGRERSAREGGSEDEVVIEVGKEGADSNVEKEEHTPTQQMLTPAAPPIPISILSSPKIPLTFLHISGARKMMTFDPDTKVRRVKELIWGGWPEEFPSPDHPPTPSYLRLLHLGRILQDEDTLGPEGLKFAMYRPVYYDYASAASASASTSPPENSSSSTSAPIPTSDSSSASSSSSPDSKLPTSPPLTIVHISIRPHGPGIAPLPGSVEADSAKKRKSRSQSLRRGLFSVLTNLSGGTNTNANANSSLTPAPPSPMTPTSASALSPTATSAPTSTSPSMMTPMPAPTPTPTPIAAGVTVGPLSLGWLQQLQGRCSCYYNYD